MSTGERPPDGEALDLTVDRLSPEELDTARTAVETYRRRLAGGDPEGGCSCSTTT